jgi:hypothetical protein
VKQGDCELIKAVYDNKYVKEEERQILVTQSKQCQKFNSNFNKAQGVRPCGRVRVSPHLGLKYYACRLHCLDRGKCLVKMR